MPRGWVAPGLLFTYRGIKIYETHDDDEEEGPINDYHYCADEAATEDEWFDVRGLPEIDLESPEVLKACQERPWLQRAGETEWTEFEEHRLQIEFAIDSGEFFDVVPQAHVDLNDADADLFDDGTPYGVSESQEGYYRLENGNVLAFDNGGPDGDGERTYVRVLWPDGGEVVYWTIDEWEEDPEIMWSLIGYLGILPSDIDTLIAKPKYYYFGPDTKFPAGIEAEPYDPPVAPEADDAK